MKHMTLIYYKSELLVYSLVSTIAEMKLQSAVKLEIPTNLFEKIPCSAKLRWLQAVPPCRSHSAPETPKAFQ